MFVYCLVFVDEFYLIICFFIIYVLVFYKGSSGKGDRELVGVNIICEIWRFLLFFVNFSFIRVNRVNFIVIFCMFVVCFEVFLLEF